MQHAKKMALVDPKLLQSFSQKNPIPPPNPTLNTMSDLDEEMRKVLDTNESIAEKVKSYNQILQSYLTHQQNFTGSLNPSKIHYNEKQDPTKNVTTDTKKDTVVSEVLESVPKTMVNKAQLLVKRLKNQPDVNWNEKGEIELNGSLIPGSNLADLVNDVLRDRKTVDGPTGWQEFARYLEKINIPQELVGNRKRLTYIKNQKLPSPPGEPVIYDNTSPNRVLRATPFSTPLQFNTTPKQTIPKTILGSRSKKRANEIFDVYKWTPY